jgi:hypothetical protein
MKHAALLTLLLFVFCNCFAQPIGLRLFTENDFLSPFAKNEDDNYTGGAKLEAVFKANGLFGNIHFLKNKLPRKPLYHTIAFTGTAFTPRNLGEAAIVPDDRPYASLLAFSIGSQYKSLKNTNVRFGYELLGGVMGKTLMGDLQGKIHRREILSFISTNRPDPKGWKNQIAYGGAFVMNLKLNHEWLLVKSKERENGKYFIPFRLSLRNNLNVGNYLINSTHGLRLNLLNKQYDFDNEIAPPEITAKAVKIKPMQKPRVFSFSLYAEPRIKIYVHNAGLTGKLLSKPSVHTIYTNAFKGTLTPALFEYEMGFVIRYYWLQLGYSLNGRSKEFSVQNKNMHHWGGIYIAIVAYR